MSSPVAGTNACGHVLGLFLFPVLSGPQGTLSTSRRSRFAYSVGSAVNRVPPRALLRPPSSVLVLVLVLRRPLPILALFNPATSPAAAEASAAVLPLFCCCFFKGLFVVQFKYNEVPTKAILPISATSIIVSIPILPLFALLLFKAFNAIGFLFSKALNSNSAAAEQDALPTH